MALAGSVTVNPTTGAYSGSGEALRLFELFLASYPTAPAASKVGVAVLCNHVATLVAASVWEPTSSVITSLYTAALGELVRCNPTGGAFQVNLPTASAFNKGRGVWVKNVSNSANVITVASASNIDGAASKALSGSRCSMQFFSDGTTWLSVGTFQSL